MDLLRTSKTYATRANALEALKRAAKKVGLEGIESLRYLIATSEDGRFAPVVIGIDFLPLAFHGVTVVS